MATQWCPSVAVQFSDYIADWPSIVPYVEHMVAGRSSRHDCRHKGRQVRASQTPDSLHVQYMLHNSIWSARRGWGVCMSVSCQQVHLSPRAAPSLSASPLPHDDVNVTAAGDGLEVSVTVRYRMTTDDCVPLKLPPKSKQKFEFYESNFKFENKPNLKSLRLSEKRNAGFNCPRPLKCIQKIAKN